ncbi:hypothetical protein Tco_0340876 [Tanacetum coccineum]
MLPTKKNQLKGDPRPEPRDPPSDGQVLQGVKFEVEPQEDHTFEVEPHGNVDHVVGSQEVQTQDLIYYHPARDREQHSAWELFSYREDSNEAAFTVAAVDKVYAHESLTFNNTIAYEVISKWKVGLKDDMDARSDVYVLSNGCRKSRDDSHDYYWKYAPGMFIHLFLYIDDMVFSCGCKAEIWATKGLLDKAMENVLGMEIVRDQSGDCDVEKNGYGLMILGCARSLKANWQHMEALSTTEAGYMMFTEAWKKKIWLKGLLAQSGYELSLLCHRKRRFLVRGPSTGQSCCISVLTNSDTKLEIVRYRIHFS